MAFGNGQDICRKVGESIYAASLVYDWCYPLLSRKEKDLLRERMLYFAAEMETGWPAFRQSAASGHGNEAQISRDLLAMAIAIYNEDPVPYKYIHYQMMENLKDIKHHLYQSGRHDQGTNYGQYRSSWDFFAALQHKRTFHYDLLPQEAGILPYYWYYLRLPDGRFTAEGDTNWIWTPAYAQINSSLLLAAEGFQEVIVLFPISRMYLLSIQVSTLTQQRFFGKSQHIAEIPADIDRPGDSFQAVLMKAADVAAENLIQVSGFVFHSYSNRTRS